MPADMREGHHLQRPHGHAGKYYGLGVDRTSNRNEYQEYFLEGLRRSVRRADNLTTFMCRLSGNFYLQKPSGSLTRLFLKCPYSGPMLTKIYAGAHFPFRLPNINFHEDVLFRPGDDAGLHTVEGQAIVGRSRVSEGVWCRVGPRC